MSMTQNSSPIRPLEQRDAAEVASLHMAGLPSPMGGRSGRALLEMYYCCVAPEHGGVGFVACEEGRVVGFVVGVWNRHRILWAALRHFPLRFIFWMGVEFGWNRFVALLRRRRGTVVAAEDGPAAPRLVGCELRPLVVAAAQRGRGLGALLCGCLIEDVRERSLPSVFLRVDCSNTAAVRCYEKLGFRIRSSDGRWMVMAVETRTRPSER